MATASEFTAVPWSVYVVSGGVGASGELLVRTVLAQFPDVPVRVTVWPHVREPGQIAEIVAQAAQENALVVHTLVNPDLGDQLNQAVEAAHLVGVDLVSALMDRLRAAFQVEPLGQPGRYRSLFSSYFKRVEAIEFAVNHDDGKRIEDLAQAEIVLIGVSRVGKTPLSIYLSMQGWKVANIPFVAGLPLPAELAQVQRERIVGLTIQPQQLLIHRRHRQQYMGIPEGVYTDRQAIVEEIRAANHLFHREGYAVVDITDKPIETSSEEVIDAVTRRLGQGREAPL
jgi:regulator of PEP synthase PpsR (kinase-PPPase family)